MIKAEDALRRLREGNDRFVSGHSRLKQALNPVNRTKLVPSQEPFAVVLGCSDSRVPVELIFDQGVGELFVVRVAGNIAGPSQLESIEFAAQQLGSRLVMVLGHTGCGAVQATLGRLGGKDEGQAPILPSITDRISAALVDLKPADANDDPDRLLRQAVRVNVRASVRQLIECSETLRRLVREDGLQVVAAEYSLESGGVSFLESA